LLIAAVTAALVAIGAVTAWRAGGPADRPLDPTASRVVVLGYLVLYGVGAVLLAAAGESTGGALLIGGSFVAIALGIVLTRRVSAPVVAVPPMTTVGVVRWLPLGLLAVIGLLGAISLAAEFGLPLLTENAQLTRTGWTGPRLDAFRWFVPPAALTLLGIALVTRRRDALAVAGAALAGVLAIEVLAASRALPFELGLAAILLALWAGWRGRLRTWVAVATVAAVIFFGVLFARVAPEGSFSGPLDAAAFAFNRTVGRVVLIGPRTIEAAVTLFPGEQPPLGGDSYLRWLDRLRGEEAQPALGSLLFTRLFPTEPPGGFAAPGVLGEGYANLGTPWALALMVALGAAATALDLALARLRPGVALRVTLAILAVVLLRTYATSLLGTAVTAAAAIGWWALVGAPWRRPSRATEDPD
jgi:hypothetical protein